MRIQHLRTPVFFVLVGLLASCASVPKHETVTTQSLLREMYDLSRLTKTPVVSYRTIQFSSYDRRSVSSESPGWFENADGFGGEPQPGFVSELRKPDKEGTGLYLLAEVDGPGAIVRGWTAGMKGVLRVYLDGAKQPIFEGAAEDFLRARTPHFLKKAGMATKTKNAFVQEESDYLPIPFRKGLRVSWEGKVRSLHFYHLQVRAYERGVRVRTFDAAADLADDALLAEATKALTEPANRLGGKAHAFTVEPDKDGAWSFDVPGDGARAITELHFDLPTPCSVESLRGTLLRIQFDGAPIPQVEAPLGDFFGSGPGLQPHQSLPFTTTDKSLTCRFVMPFQKNCKITLLAHKKPLKIAGRVTARSWEWTDRSLYFRAKWRVDHGLVATVRGHDIPYVVALGRGRLVGAACMLMNPSPIPTMGGNWWGEGDEKIFVDGESVPSTFGTGSEDYYNYAWSRPKLFAHPYCGQPLTTGPDTSGYVSNHRFHILDDIPFDRSLAFFMELKHHTKTPGFTYARITYHYARPGTIDDHPPLLADAMYVPKMPVLEPVAKGMAKNARFFVPKGSVDIVEADGPSGRKLRGWHAKKKGERRKLVMPMKQAGKYKITLVAHVGKQAGSVRVFLNGKLMTKKQTRAEKEKKAKKVQTLKLQSDIGTDRVRNFYLEEAEFKAGDNEVVLEADTPGLIQWDYIWYKGPAVEVPGALEGEDLEVLTKSEGLGTSRQELDNSRWSRGRQIWVQSEAVGQFIEFALPVKKPGTYRLQLKLTESWDYGIIQPSLNGKPLGKPIDTHNKEGTDVGLTALLDLGTFELKENARLRFEVTGTNPKSKGVKYFFGLDYVLLTATAKE